MKKWARYITFTEDQPRQRVPVIETFLNEKGKKITPGLFGSLFDYYICGKFMQAHSRQQFFDYENRELLIIWVTNLLLGSSRK